MIKSDMKTVIKLIFLLVLFQWTSEIRGQQMMYTDTSRTGKPFAKDPKILKFKGEYFMYYSITSAKDGSTGSGIGIAKSSDLTNWIRVGELRPVQLSEGKNIGAPGGIVLDNKIHLFYQGGSFLTEGICHAISENGIDFTRDPSNPIFKPTGDWNCGRAIDAEVEFYKGRWLMLFATRDPDKKIQIIGAAEAPEGSDFSRSSWKQIGNAPVFKPELPWEMTCIEAPSTTVRNGELYMFYAGAYNNSPQQVGVAKSTDGINWTRISDKPILANGDSNSWNSSESGHPEIFRDTNGKYWLFYQGNNNKGKTWHLSNIAIRWKKGVPEVVN
jgi:predicted GH43/DUF377 family glycosyl hydrolase